MMGEYSVFVIDHINCFEHWYFVQRILGLMKYLVLVCDESPLVIRNFDYSFRLKE